MQNLGVASPSEPVLVERWSTERPLLALVVLASIGIWILLAMTAIGLLYVALIALFLFVSHLAFVAHLRGSAVRLGPEQFPDLYRRVEELASRIGLRRMPAVYLMQAGGTLNALATKFLRTSFVVLFSDLLEACGDNSQARDMIIAHELGHLKERHLSWRWFLLPGLSTPFLGGAYSRAREYTCDRYGGAVCDDRRAAVLGLAILAAGGHHGPKVNLQALARQDADLGGAWMTLGRWLATHPPLAHRVAALDPDLAAGSRARPWGAVGALGIISTGVVLLVASSMGLALLVRFGMMRPILPTVAAGMNPEQAEMRARSDINALAEFVEAYRKDTGSLPEDTAALYRAWRSRRFYIPVPVDAFDGQRYGYEVRGDEFHIWSAGVNPQEPSDDIYFESKAGAFR
jgi:Zn-dependent protease with chaperone function